MKTDGVNATEFPAFTTSNSIKAEAFYLFIYFLKFHAFFISTQYLLQNFSVNISILTEVLYVFIFFFIYILDNLRDVKITN